jgi:rRNA small subunit pseudouridine methyltransferase Nep1
MSATAAEFTPASSTTPASASASASADPVGQQLKSDKDGIMSSTGQSEATKRAMADAVAASRVTKPLPGSRRTGVGADFVPKQAEVPKGAEAKEGTRRLILVLSQVGLSSE